MGDDASELDRVRAEVISAMGNEAMVESAGIVGTFSQMVRIADSTGIPLDQPLEAATGDMREEIGLNAFGSARNTFERA